MNAVEHRPCYGAMFPHPLRVTEPGRSTGNVFSLVAASPAGMCRARPRVEINRAQWDHCLQCPEFEHCYKLSMAKLALETAASTM